MCAPHERAQHPCYRVLCAVCPGFLRGADIKGDVGATRERPEKLNGTHLPTEKITQIIRLLVEGCSVRPIERITGTHRATILNVLALAGERCERLLESRIRQVPVKDVECDEIWG